MRAMPSPTSSTRPVSRASSLLRNCSISACNTETISSALNLITASRNDLVLNLFQLFPNRLIVEPVADAHDQAAQQIRVDRDFEQRLLVQRLPHLAAELLLLIVGQRHGARHLHARPSRPFVEQLVVCNCDCPEEPQSLVFG